MSENALSRAIMVGLALLSGGAHAAVPPTAAAEPFDPADLTGLVALDGELSPELEIGDLLAGDPSGNCPGPSGCVADLILSTLAIGGADRLQWVTTPGVAVIQNSPFSGLAAENVAVTIQSDPDQSIIGEGCLPAGASSVTCSIGRLEVGATVALPFVIEPNGSTRLSWQVVVAVSSLQPDPIPNNNSRSSSVQLAPHFERFARVAQINPQGCPVIEADVSITDHAGVPNDGPWPGPGLLDVFDDGQWAGSPIAIDPNEHASSVVFLLDDSASVDAARLHLHKSLVLQAASDWQQAAAMAGTPLPAFGATTTSGPAGVAAISADLNVLGQQLATIHPSSATSRLYEALMGSTAALTARPGRNAVVAFVEAGDGTGSVLANPLQSLQSTGVPIYPIVGRSELEPLARHIAKASAGFRQVSLAGDQAALANTMGAILRQTRLSWVAPAGGEPRRDVLISQRDSGLSPFDASGWYSQRDSSCARPCVASRTLPAIGSNSNNSFSLVRLEIDPGDRPLTFSLRETVPAGVTVDQISDGGLYFPADRSIRWDGKQISAPVEFTYRAYHVGSLHSAGSSVTFKGALSSTAMLFPTCGDTTTTIVPRHPADVETFGRVLPAVAQAYADSWRRGWPWVDGISPIPIAHLTRAGQIQASGVSYRRMDAPVPWVLNSPPPLPYVLSAYRSGPSLYVPGGPVAITLQVEPHGQATYGAVEEHIPGGWAVVSVGQDGVFVADDGVIRWGPFQDNQVRTLDYTMLAPAGATEAVVLVGRYSVDGDQKEFSGRGSLGNAQIDPLFADGFE